MSNSGSSSGGSAAYAPVTAIQAPLTEGVPVALGGYTAADSTKNSIAGSYRLPYYVAQACTDLRLAFSNSFLSSGNIDSDNSTSVTFSAAVEVPVRTVTDGVLNGTTTITSATAAFVSANDVGRLIFGAGIPTGTTIASVTNSTTAVLSAAATVTGSGVTLSLADVQPVTFGGAAQPTIAPGGQIQSDVLPVEIPQGFLYVRIYLPPYSVSTGLSWASGASSISDAAITAAHTGRRIQATGVPGNTYVGTVTPGVSYLLSTSPTSQAGSAVTSAAQSGVPVVYAQQYYATRFTPGGTGITGGGGVPTLSATTGQQDLTQKGSAGIADTTSSYPLFAPIAILGNPRSVTRPATALIIGDSISVGQSDGAAVLLAGLNATTLQWGAGGYIHRGLFTAGVGAINAGKAGDSVQQYIAANGHWRRIALGRRAATVICNYGRNDVTNGRTLAQIQADLLTAWTMHYQRRQRTFQTTITPRTTSTDGWLTTANQTSISNDSVRVALNGWLRDGAPIDGSGNPVAVGTAGANRALSLSTTGTTVQAASGTHPLYAVVEVTDIVESARDSGLHKPLVVGRTGSDGAFSGASFQFTSAGAAWTSADRGLTLVVPGAGLAGATLATEVQTITSATVVNLTTPSNTAVSAANWTVGGGTTIDGLHYQPYMANLMGQAIAAAAPLFI